MSQPTQTLNYQAKPPLSAARRQSIWLLRGCAALFILVGVNFLGCDVIYFVNSHGPGHLPSLTFWRYTLFSFELWRRSPAEALQGLIAGAVFAAIFYLIARGIRRGRRWPAFCGMILAFLISLVGVMGCVAIVARLFSAGTAEPSILQAISVLLVVGIIALFPLTGVKLLKVWRERTG